MVTRDEKPLWTFTDILQTFDADVCKNFIDQFIFCVEATKALKHEEWVHFSFSQAVAELAFLSGVFISCHCISCTLIGLIM